MKFAHEFKEVLQREGYPEHWVDSAIPYGRLKKLLKKVQRELSDLGLDRDTLRQLLIPPEAPSSGGPVAMAKYYLDRVTNIIRENESNVLRPRLTVYVHLRDGVPVDASLSPGSRALVQKLLSKAPTSDGDVAERWSVATAESAGAESEDSSRVSEDLGPTEEDQDQRLQRIEVPLVFDGEFFHILQSDVSSLDTLQKGERRTMETDIARLGQEIAKVSKPSRYSKSDLSRWREIFELYLDARIFFSAYESDHGARTSEVALAQLVWFQTEVNKRALPSKFKMPASHGAYQRFLSLNATLLRNLKFQEINRIAVTKILKKFDKRTSLGVSRNFPAIMPSGSFMGETVSKKICAQVATEVVSQVPRLDDYLCPVCFGIAWLPVRLACHHVFCIRCMIKMQRKKEHACPLCRANVVMDADTANLDDGLIKFLERWFRKETKEKQKANEIERGKELFGEQYQHSTCHLM